LEDNIKADIQQKEWEIMNKIYFGQDGVQRTVCERSNKLILQFMFE